MVFLEHPGVFCLLWPRMPERLLFLAVPWPVCQDPPHCSLLLLFSPCQVIVVLVDGTSRMLLWYLTVRSSWSRFSSWRNCFFIACSTKSSWYLFPVAANIMFLSFASIPLFCRKKPGKHRLREQMWSFFMTLNTQCLSSHSMDCSWFPFQEIQFHLDHALEPASENLSRSTSSSEFRSGSFQS